MLLTASIQMRNGGVCFLVALLIGLPVDGIADDAIGAKVDIALEAYEKAIEELNVEIKVYLDKQITRATSSGDQDAIAQLEGEKTFYQSRGFVPASAPVSLHKRQIAAAERFARVADVAAKAYTKAGDSTAAQLAEAERDKVAAVAVRSKVRQQLVGAWRLNTPGYSTTFIFYPDGTMDHTTEKMTMKWRIDPANGRVLCELPNKGTETILLPINPRGTEGFGGQGNRWVLKKVR